jgi:hypothetical protein
VKTLITVVQSDGLGRVLLSAVLLLLLVGNAQASEVVPQPKDLLSEDLLSEDPFSENGGFSPVLCYGRICGPPVEGEGSCGTCPEGYSCADNGERCTAKYHGNCRVGAGESSGGSDYGVWFLLLLLGAFIFPIFGVRLAKRKSVQFTTFWGSR